MTDLTRRDPAESRPNIRAVAIVAVLFMGLGTTPALWLMGPPAHSPADSSYVSETDRSETPGSANATFVLYGSMAGWGTSAGSISRPGPTLSVRPAQNVTLQLYSSDGITHDWFIDFTGSMSPAVGDVVSPDFSSPTTPTVFTFEVPAKLGTWTYRCAYHPTQMYGSIIIANSVTTGTSSPAASSTGNYLLLSVGVLAVLVGVLAYLALAGAKGAPEEGSKTSSRTEENEPRTGGGTGTSGPSRARRRGTPASLSGRSIVILVVLALLFGLVGGVFGGFEAARYWGPTSPSPTSSALPAIGPEVTPTNNVVQNASNVPPPINRTATATDNIYIEAEELVGQLEPGTSYTYWTYNGTVPGPFLRVLVNDTVVVHFTNSKTSTMTHSIDFHAVIGPGGGMPLDTAAPGQSVTFTFKAMNPGLFVYHCGTPDASEHIANGMFGLILVQPSVPLPPVDREFYVMQSELYTEWPVHTAGNQLFDRGKLLNETPTYFVFNGAYQALTKTNELHAAVNQTIRIYFGNAGPNFFSAFHIIGEILDRAWQYGDLIDPPLHGVQSITVPPGAALVADVHLLYPGNYNMVDHDLTRAVDLGALGVINVTGPANHTIYGNATGTSFPTGGLPSEGLSLILPREGD